MASFNSIHSQSELAADCLSAIDRLARSKRKVHLEVNRGSKPELIDTSTKTSEQAIQIINQTIAYYFNSYNNSDNVKDHLKFYNRLNRLQDNLDQILFPEDLKQITFLYPRTESIAAGHSSERENLAPRSSTPPLSHERLELILPKDSKASIIREEVMQLESEFAELQRVFRTNGRIKTPEMNEFESKKLGLLEEKKKILGLYAEKYETLYEVEQALRSSFHEKGVPALLEKERAKVTREIGKLDKLTTIKKVSGGQTVNSPQILGLAPSPSDPVISKISDVASPMRVCVVEKPIYDKGFTDEEGPLAGLHELIGFHIDLQFERYFKVPPVTIAWDPVGERYVTRHHFIEGATSLKSFIADGAHLSEKETRKIILFTLLLGLTDAHLENFLVRETGSPRSSSIIPVASSSRDDAARELREFEALPIDLGRMLVADPLSQAAVPRLSAFLRDLNTNSKFSKEEKELILSQKPEELADLIRNTVKFDQLPPEQREIFEKKILHLQANLVMLQTAMTYDLTVGQVLALKLINLNKLVKEKKIETYLQRINQNEMDSRTEGPHIDMTEAIVGDFLSDAGMNQYFDEAWSYASKKEPHNPERFLNKFQKKLSSIIRKELKKRHPFTPVADPNYLDISLLVMDKLKL